MKEKEKIDRALYLAFGIETGGTDLTREYAGIPYRLLDVDPAKVEGYPYSVGVTVENAGAVDEKTRVELML